MNFFKDLFIYIWKAEVQSELEGKRDRERERKRGKEREKERACLHPLIHSPMLRLRQAEARSQEPGTSSGSPMWVEEPKGLGHFCCFSRCIIRELEHSGASRTLTDTHMGHWQCRWRLSLLCHCASTSIRIVR